MAHGKPDRRSSPHRHNPTTARLCWVRDPIAVETGPLDLQLLSTEHMAGVLLGSVSLRSTCKVCEKCAPESFPSARQVF